MSDNALPRARFTPKKRACRKQRGADWGTFTLQSSLLSTAFWGFGANTNTTTVGFRVAAVHIPEPGSVALAGQGLVGLLRGTRRR